MERNAQSKLKEAIELHQKNQLTKAEALYESVLAANDEHPKANHLYGLLKYQTSNKKTGIQLVEKSIQLNPADTLPYIDLLKMYKLEQKLEDAAALLKDYYERFGDGKALVERAGLLRKLGKNEEAVLAYQAALANMPAVPQLHYNLANVLMELSRENDARTHLEMALKLDANFSEAALNLAILHNKSGGFERSLEVSKRLFETRPSLDAYLVRSTALMGLHQFAEARNLLTRGLEQYADAEQLWEPLSYVSFKLREYSQAKAAANSVLAFDKHNATALCILGMIAAKSGEEQVAMEALVRSFELNPQFYETQIALLDLLPAGHALTERLITSVKDVLASCFYENKKAATQLEFRLGRFYERIGDYDAALSCFKNANTRLRDTYEYNVYSEIQKFAAIEAAFPSNNVPDALSSDQPTPIFIVGMPRSGTSLLEQMLSCHQSIEAMGELTTLSEILHEMTAQSEIFTETEFQLLAKEYRRRVRLSDAHKPYFTDKLPHNFLYIGYILGAMPEAKILVCERAPIETCFSIYKHQFEGDLHRYGQSFEELAEYYRAYNKLVQHWKTIYGNRLFTVPYEELIAHPEKILKQTLDYCGLPFDAACLSYFKSKRFVHTASEFQVRKPIYTTSLNLSEKYGAGLNELRERLSRVRVEQ